MNRLRESIERFEPGCEQEQADRRLMLQALDMAADAALSRDNLPFHFSASSIIVNPARTHTLMAFHNLYKSWAWTGGHADGDADLLSVALREANEETGIAQLRVLTTEAISLEALTVEPHVKRGKFVPAHIHMNLTYALEADDRLPIRCKPDENARVGWLPIAALPARVSEPYMIGIYQKILDRILQRGL